jgi:integrase/recombinase XerD
MPRVNIIKQLKMDGRWIMRSIPRKKSGGFDWKALPDGRYYIEWYEQGNRRREFGGSTVAEVLEAQRRKRHELEGRKLRLPGYELPDDTPKKKLLSTLVEEYLAQIETLKKPNTYRKYESVLERFSGFFVGRSFGNVSTDHVNEYVVHLKKAHSLSANTILHHAIIIAQFFKRNGRGGITRFLQLPEPIKALPKEYREEELAQFLKACDLSERALFSTFLFTGFREQEMIYLEWTDIHLDLRTVRVTSKPDVGFYPKRWEEREVPIPAQLVEILRNHPHHPVSRFVFPSPRGNREQRMLNHCKDIAERAGLDPEKFDLKTFRSTYATRMLRAGFDVRTVQHWMGHKSLETTMRYLVPATEVHARLDKLMLPGSTETPGSARKSAKAER